RIATFQFIKQSSQYARAARSNRMSKSDGATINIYFRWIKLELASDRAGSGRKRLVNLDQVDFIKRPACLLQDLLNCSDRGHHNQRWRDTRSCISNDSGQRLATQLLCLFQ